jgi:hypothetical protein
MPALFALTLFLSSFLLFLIQPMIGKMILPVLGGTPAVWNTCIVFFQTMLLAGYLYAHGLSRWTTRQRRPAPVLHLGLVLLPLLTLPLLMLPICLSKGISLPPKAPEPFLWLLQQTRILNFLHQMPDPDCPIPWLLTLLLVCIGLPFFLISATAPLLQHWFASLGGRSSRDPYFSYAASNLGSLVALLAYPTVVEPYLRLPNQADWWTAGYVLLVVLIGICALSLWRFSPPENDEASTNWPESVPISMSRRLRWIMLAAIPSSLLLGVTTYLSTDVASVPLLWIIPLSLYLLTFVLVFARKSLISHAWVTRAVPLFLLMQTFLFAVDLKRSIWILFLLHLTTFFMIAMFCHGELAKDRPSPRHLTEFYLCLSAGGVLGSLFNAILAPLLFNRLLEYPLALVLACLLLPGRRSFSAARSSRRWSRGVGSRIPWADLWMPLSLGLLMIALTYGIETVGVKALWLKATLLFGLPAAICYTFIQRPVRFALGLGALLLTGGLGGDPFHSRLIYQERSFFGVMTVVERSNRDEPVIVYRHFVHGNTKHGQQCRDSQWWREPLAYFTRTGPIGQLFDAFAQSPKNRYAVLGLGAGTLACYGEKGQEWTFYEIDPAVIRIAENYFTFLQDCRERECQVKIIPGDARLSLRDAPDKSFDMIFADAFSSDAVPVHLLTREALQLYLNKLADDGLIVFNITNRYVDLGPILGALAEDAGLHCLGQEEDPTAISEEEQKHGKLPSHWLVMVRQPADLRRLIDDPKWKPVKAGAAVWTDDYCNLLSAFRWN